MPHPYFEEPLHRILFHPYQEDYCLRTFFLAFTREWRDKHLPPERSNDFIVTILDTSDGKKYQVPKYVAYEGDHSNRIVRVDEENWAMHQLDALQGYFYCDHYCPCHIKCDAKAAGADTDEECEGTRFQIESIVAKGMPDLILMSETISEGELNARLEKLRH